MFKNLRSVLSRKGITIEKLAENLSISESSIQNKLNGKSEFTYSEFKKICLLLHEYNADYLFTTE